MAVFTVKRFETLVQEIAVQIVRRVPKITDLTPGSVLRSIVEGVSAVLSELYTKAFLGFRRLLGTVAQDAFSFERKGGTFSRGNVRFTRVSGTLGTVATIETGTQVFND